MGQGNLSRAGGLILAVLVAGSLAGQPMLQERRYYAHTLAQRRALLELARGREPEVLKKLVELFAGHEGPLVSHAKALAVLRGVKLDDDALIRSGTVCFALPEVLDREAIDTIGVAMHTPAPVPPFSRARFEVRLLGAGGKELELVIKQDTEPEDLLRFRAASAFPTEGLQAGLQSIAVHMTVDGRPPRESDAKIAAAVVLLDGWRKRRDELHSAIQSLTELELPVRAALAGLVLPIDRVFEGEPSAVLADAAKELLDAERAVANLSADLPWCDNLTGWVSSAVALAADEVVYLRLRLPSKPEAKAKPWVLFVPGSPVWDAQGNRPTSPRFTAPDDLACQLQQASFDADHEFGLAVLESPGRVRDHTAALLAVANQLRSQFGATKFAVVAEREAAFSACLASHKAPLDEVLVCVAGSGPIPESTRCLAITASGHSSTENIRRMRGKHLTLLESGARPWPIALGLSLPEIERFLRAELSR